jgi:hypothetical protein
MNFNKNGKVFMSKYVGTGPSSYKKRTTGLGLIKVEKHLSRRCGRLNVSLPYRPSWPVTGIDLIFLLLS